MADEYFTTVTATVRITLRSERPLTEEEVGDVLSETPYEFGYDDGEGVGLEDGESVHICATEWFDNDIVKINAEGVH